jgi:hypothetical protein
MKKGFNLDRDGVHLIFPKSAYVTVEEAAKDFADFIGAPVPTQDEKGGFLVDFNDQKGLYRIGTYGYPKDKDNGVFDYEILMNSPLKNDPNLTAFEARVNELLEASKLAQV